MALILAVQGGEVESFGTSVTQYGRGAANASRHSTANEVVRSIKYTTAGIASRLWIKILTNDRGASTFRLRKNAADGNMVIAIGDSMTGEFEDTTNTDTIVATNTVSLQIATGAGGTTYTFNMSRFLFSANSSTVTPAGTQGDTISGTTNYTPIGGGNATVTIEINQQAKSYITGTWRNLGAYSASNTRDGAIVVNARINGANGTQSVTMPAGTTGWFEDLVNTDAIAPADLLCYQRVPGGTVGSVSINMIKSDIITENKTFLLTGNHSNSQAANTVGFLPIAGMVVGNGTENNVSITSGLAFTAANLSLYVSGNGVTADSQFRLRKNGADGNLLLTIPASTTGFFQDTVNTDSIIPTDVINYSLTTGATGTNLVIRTNAMVGTTAGGGGSTLLYMGAG